MRADSARRAASWSGSWPSGCAKAARRRLKEIQEVEDLPEEVTEALLRRAYDVGARISPDIVDDERRERARPACRPG